MVRFKMVHSVSTCFFGGKCHLFCVFAFLRFAYSCTSPIAARRSAAAAFLLLALPLTQPFVA